MVEVFAGLKAAHYQPHALHHPARDWPQTNCYVDVWIEILRVCGLAPEAGLGFTVALDFEGDQFTFFKFPLEDIERLYGIRVQELAIYDTLERHVECQMARGNLCLIEVDGYFLPDTAGMSYQNEHTKTTIAINRLDRAGRSLDYFHNDGFFSADGDDFDGLFGHLPQQRARADWLFPYVEFAKLPRTGSAKLHHSTSLALLRQHFSRRPSENPVLAWRAVLGAHVQRLIGNSPDAFHKYAFNTARQLGANFELLAAHLHWLSLHGEAGLQQASLAASHLSASVKSLQFQLARAVARRRYEGVEALLDPVAAQYDDIMRALRPKFAD